MLAMQTFSPSENRSRKLKYLVKRYEVVLLLLTLLWATPASSQEFYFLGGDLKNAQTSDHTYSWELKYSQALGENFTCSFSYLNEGHLPNNHRDGLTPQLWAREQALDNHLSVAVGFGPYIYFDTMASGAGDYSNSHGYGAIVSGSVTWYTQNRWLGLIQVNWIKARSSVDTVSGLVGIGYQLDAPPSKESPVMTQSSQTGPFKNEISGLIGMTIQNSYDSEEATAYSVEYRRRLWRYLDWTVAWIYEGDDQLSRRNGLATQLWAVRSFF